MKECDILGRSKHTLTSPTYFLGSRFPTPGSTPLAIVSRHYIFACLTSKFWIISVDLSIKHLIEVLLALRY